MMHGKDFRQTILLDEPNHVTYLVYGRTYTKAPSLPTEQVSETTCQGEWLEYEANHPLSHMVAYYDEVHLQTVNMVVEDGKVIDKDRQWSLPCPWEARQCHAAGRTYIWNAMESEYCPVAVVKEFLSHRLHANISGPDGSLNPRQTEAIISSEGVRRFGFDPPNH